MNHYVLYTTLVNVVLKINGCILSNREALAIFNIKSTGTKDKTTVYYTAPHSVPCRPGLKPAFCSPILPQGILSAYWTAPATTYDIKL